MAFIPCSWQCLRRREGQGRMLEGRRGRGRVAMVAQAGTQAVFSAAGMNIEEFFERSFGSWRSQRSSHTLAFAQFEAITGEIEIERLEESDARLAEVCATHAAVTGEVTLGLQMRWEAESDWDDDEDGELAGESTMAVIKDGERHGRLLRSAGYAETIPAVGTWRMTADGVFVLETKYEAAAAEERIWFATENLRMRVSQIRTSSMVGVVSASLSTEIRRLSV